MLNTGESPGRSGLFHHPAQFRTGEAEARSIGDEDLDGTRDFWSVAAAGGHRVVVVDPIQAPLMTAPGPAIQLVEWGTHDALAAPRSHPQSLLAEIGEIFDPYPIAKCDDHDRSEPRYVRLLDGLVSGAKLKARVVNQLLRRNDWDLATAVFTEAHCAGHQLWHFSDPDHPWYAPSAEPRLQSALLEVYRAVDDALGSVLAEVSSEVTIAVVASHGIDRFRRASALLPDVLERLGYGPGKQARLRLGAALPAPVKQAARRIMGQSALNRLQLGASSRVLRFDGHRTKALAVANGSVGAIRLNLVGREPDGSVEPGGAADAILDDVGRAVQELHDPATGQGITGRVVRTADEFGPDHHPDLPDLLIEFRSDLGTLETAESPRLGRFGPPVATVRSGDHRLMAQWWFIGSSVRPGALPAADILDVAPTVLGLLGIDPPDWMDGVSRAPMVEGNEARGG
jgi:predicted AlkP superfamily phosphohydrolase/phosphomutase